MLLYRIHSRLLVNARKGVYIDGGPGAVNCLDGMAKKTIEILITCGAISPVRAPTLGDLPGWTVRAKRLQEAGYDTIGFVLAKSDDVIDATRDEDMRDWSHQNVKKWQHEVRSYLGFDGYTAPKRG